MSFTSNFLEELDKKKKKRIENAAQDSGMLYRNKTATEDDIAPVVSKATSVKAVEAVNEQAKAEKDDGKWFQKGAFEDGYQLGDVTKSLRGTVGDVSSGLLKGVLSPIEGISDFILHGAGYVADAIDGEGRGDVATFLHDSANLDTAGTLINPLEKYHSKNSLVGENVDKAENVIGAFGGQLGLAAATGGWSLLATGVSAAGSGMTEAYNNGATDAEAGIYGISIGAIEAGTEALSGGLGKYVKALGFSKGIGGLDDMFAKKLTSKITDLTLKNAAEWGIKATGEGLEEVLAGLGSAVAKKLTYMSEEDLGKLVKDENLLDSFLIGTVMSGVSQSGVIPGTKKGSLMEANKTKSDFVTGLTANEDAVVNKEVENRIAEKEADGETLTKKDKAEIYEKVVEDMKRGYISTDTIEEVLSGEGYKAYDGLVKESEEYNELYNTKSGELSEAQKDRLAELKAKNEAQSYEDQIKAARVKLSSDTFNLLKGERNGAGSLLGESYNERARRGQKYEADLTKYNEKQKAVVQKAIDSGILNNTNRTHEFVDMVAKISADKGVLFDFTDNAKLKESGFAIDGKSVNGYVTKDGVTLNIDSKKALDTVAGHEITHVLEGTELYGELQKAIFDYAKSKGEYQGRYDTLKKLYEGVEGADVDAELTADLVGDYLFSDSDFINKLSTEHRNVFQKIYDEIKYLCKVATAGSKEARELERVKRAFEKVYKESGKANEGTKYSLNEFKDGQRFVSVEANQEQFDGLSVKEQTDLATKIIKERFQGKVIGIDNKAFVNGKTADEYTHPAKHLDADSYEAKMRASTELDNIMDAGFNFRNEADGKDGHTHSDAVGGFDYFDAIFKVGSEYYQGVINIKNVNRGKLLKDITKIKNITQDMTSRYGENPSYAFLRDVSMEIVPQKETNVKGKFSLSSDSEGRQLPEAVKKRFGNSKVVDENGSLKVVYHGTATGEFSIFDKAKGSVEGDYGSGFYFTDNEADVSEHYEGGGPDFDNKVGRRADEIWDEEPDVEYEEAERRAREELYKGSHKFEVYLNMENPATVGETMLFDQESYLEQYNEEDYDDYDDYMGDVEQLIADDIDGIIWDIERNVDIDSTDGIANVLYDAVAEGGIGLEELKKRLNGLYLEDSNGQLVANEVARQIVESLGYDGIIDPTVSGKWNMDIEPGTTHYIVFKPNQIKAVTNENPTDNPDIHRSLSAEGDTSGRYGNVYGEGVRYTAPVAEDLTGATETAEKTENTAPIQNVAEGENEALEDIMPEGFAPVTEEEANTLASENLASLDDADAPAEIETEYNEALDNTRVDDKAVKDISKSLADVLALDAKETGAIGDVVQRYSTGEISEAELFDEIKSKFGEKTVEHIDEQTAEVKRALRDYKLFVSDTIKGDIPEYNNLRKKLFGRLFTKTRENGGMPVDTAYMELSERYPGYFPEDIINPTDQFLLMAQYAQDDAKTHERYKLDDEDIQSAVDVIVSEVGKTKEAAVMQNAEEDRRALMDEIAPVAEKTPDKAYEAIRPPKQSKEPRLIRVKDGENIAPTYETKKSGQVNGQRTMFAEGKTAEVYDTEPEVVQKKRRGWSKFVSNFVDKQNVFETLSLKTHNRELMGKANYMLSSESRAQWMIGNGSGGVKSLNSIREEVESTGKTKQFYEYLYHKHNVDRMNLDTRYEDMENKPVFGDSVTAEVSQSVVDRYEATNPEFKGFAEDVYTYLNHLRGQMVESGVISQETADLWAEMYPHYVPIRRLGDSGLNVNVPLDTRKTGVNAPVKRATGGSRDILPLFDTMAMRTEQTFKAIAKNNFGVELKNTLGTTIESTETSLDEVLDNIDKHEDLLQEGKDGKNPTFTVFENGEKVTFEITEDMYDALKPTSDGLRYTNKVANTVGKAHRGILTEYNPVFMASNAIKDAQDILINSQHPAKTYANLPKAIGELATKGKWYREYMENGGEQNTYFDGQTNTFKKEEAGIKKIIGMPLRAISAANNYVERAPRLAEYIASRKAGASVEVSMLNAARVTTNFQAGGDVTKFLNRNGATFLNASVQGFNQQVRNIREAKANGLKGWVQLATKVAIAGLPAMLLNHLLWDDDEDYEELSDYVKDNYYVVAKYGDGQFVRIPKGRTLAVIQNAFEQVSNALTGDDEVDLESFLELAISNLAPNNPVEDNILAPIIQAANNETWYGEDLVPTRLQDLPEAEQYDESTDALSKWLGEKLNVSPYKLNYLLDQYSGGLGDVLLPMMTPEAERGDNSVFGNIIAPIKDKFTTDSVMNNQNVSDFYDTVDELTKNANSIAATDEDILKSKYMNSVSAELGELYQQKREIQNDSDLTDAEKYAAVRDVQKEIDTIAKNGLGTYGDVDIDGVYATVGNVQFRWYEPGEDSETEPGWKKLTDDQIEKQDEVTSGLGISPSEYWSNNDEYNFAYEYPEKYEFLNNNGVTYDDYKNGSEEFKDAYTWASKNPEKFTLSKAVADDVVEYRRYAGELYDIKADKDSSGKSIVGSRKEKVLDYINGLDIDYGKRIILFKNEYNADDTYNYDIIEYLNGREDISYEEMETILKELGFTVDSKGNISW